MSIGGGEWSLWRDGEPFSQRFAATFSEDRKHEGVEWAVVDA